MANLMRLVFFGCLLLWTTLGYSRTLQLVTLQYPPYEYKEGLQVKGIAVDIIREAFRRLSQPIEITLLPWPRAISYIENGKADAIFTAFKKPHRETFADYSKEVLFPQTISLFVRADSNIVYDGHITSLKPYSVSVINKVSYGQFFDTALKQGELTKIKVSNSGKQSAKMLLAQRVDIWISNKYGAFHIANQLNELEGIRALEPHIQSVPSYIAFSKKRNLTHIRDQLDVVLKAMKEDGSYDQIINRYFENIHYTE